MAPLILLLIILVTLLLIRKKVDLGLIMFLNALILGLSYRVTPGEIFFLVGRALIARDILLTTGALVLILYLSALLEASGRIGRFVDGLSHVFNDIRLVVAFIPALIGLVPIVAGAIISAPLIVKAADELRLSQERRTFLNYWFRHIWEYTVPTYPGVILSSAILGCEMSRVSAANLSLTIMAILAGLSFGFFRIKPFKVKAAGPGLKRLEVLKLFNNIWPLLAVLIITLGFSVHLFYPLVPAIAYLIWRDKPTRKQLIKIISDPATLKMVYLVAGIISFKAMLEGTGMVQELGGGFARSGIPGMVIIILLPFIVGLLTGITLAPVGVTFPILLPYFTAGGAMHWGLFSLAYAAGYSGVLLSPVHLCLSTTIAYFKADMGRFYRLLAAPVLMVFLVGLLLAALD